MNEPRSVLVTGGNRGIGRAIAEAFLANGDKVAVTTRSGGAPEGALELKADITDATAVDAAFAAAEEAHGPVEVLVANAGITADTLLLRMSEDDWQSVIDTNLTGSFRLAKRAAKGMLRPEEGPDHLHLQRRRPARLARPGQLRRRRRPVWWAWPARWPASSARGRSPANVVAPGYVDTDMTAVLTDEQKEGIRSQVPLGRYAAPDGGRRSGALAGEPVGVVRHRRGDPGRRRTRNGALTMTESTINSNGILAGKNVLVAGVTLDTSIGFAVAKFAQEQGATVVDRPTSARRCGSRDASSSGSPCCRRSSSST